MGDQVDNDWMDQERRYSQQQLLEEIRDNIQSLRTEVGSLRVDMADRVGKLENSTKWYGEVIKEHDSSIRKHSWMIAFACGGVSVLAWLMVNIILKK
jgi:hypothetical protein